MNRPRKGTRGKWHKGPPPSIGWWPASYYRSMHDIRWWDGVKWSLPCRSWMPKRQASERAKLKAVYFFDIEWTDRPEDWPKRSRT